MGRVGVSLSPRSETICVWVGNTHSVMPVDNYQNADYKKTDGRGRVTLGKEHANATVAVAWSEVDVDPEDTIRPSEQEREKLSELTRWAIEHNFSVLDYDVQEGRIYTDSAEWIDTDVEGLNDE